ncbi:GNAT family N-acetyltransferase [Marinilactibacillus kalidii]|uniref:GNAT family N-acetyltransferase n=1 Tax=Marinilactibacillus kalidii TaxID=2820274 RepID=UPI001ABE347B|nr:GNAT family N-acetyltransferase [Marinilactibacillus kalidii]
MQLRKLLITDEHAYRTFVDSWGDENIVPTSADFEGQSYSEYLKQLILDEAGRTGWVPAETYFLFLNEDEIAGAINCRYKLNDRLKHLGGHIGYGVSPIHRRQGLAQTMVSTVLPLFKERGIESVVITADDQNKPSIQTILNQNGQRESSGVKDDGRSFGRYWITL